MVRLLNLGSVVFLAGMCYHTLKVQVECCWSTICKSKMNFQSLLLGFYFVMFSQTPLCDVEHLCLLLWDWTDIPLLVHYIVVQLNVCVCLIDVEHLCLLKLTDIFHSKTMFLNIHFRMGDWKMFRCLCKVKVCFCALNQLLWISSVEG